jgi:carbonic anhydrase
MAKSDQQKAAAAALGRLKVGNDRFVTGKQAHPAQSENRRTELWEHGQKPFAIVLGCADSRIPPELIFDQGLGDLFVIRVAGNVVDETVLASIEYAAAHLLVPLVMVLAHSQCGAVGATLAGGKLAGHLPGLAKRIAPAVKQSARMTGDKNENAEKCHALAMVEQLRRSEPVLAELVGKAKVEIIAAYYNQETGIVEYLD